MTSDTLYTIQPGASVLLAYTLQMSDGTLQTIPGAPSPVAFVVGDGQLPRRMEASLFGLMPGDERRMTLSPDEAFGPLRSERIVQIERSRFTPGRSFTVGRKITLRYKDGRLRQGVVLVASDDMVHVDFNHPLAGKIVILSVQVLDVQPAPEATPAEEGA